MAEITLTKARIQSGVWEGVLDMGRSTELPSLEVSHLAKPIGGMNIEDIPDRPGQYLVRVPIPAELLSEGVQTFVISDKTSGDNLAHFAVVTGQPLDDDIVAELDLLRAELDMLKRAFRRHCLDTM